MNVVVTVFDTDEFSLEHLADSPENEALIADFSVSEKTALGLENYLKFSAFPDEDDNTSRTYLVKDKATGELAGYFSLRTGLITLKIDGSEPEKFETIPAIELSNFALNSVYKKNHPEVSALGSYIFRTFIQPLAKCLSEYVGINALYLYALPSDKLIEHYGTMGFRRLSPKNEKFVQSHIKPKYDEGCIFMFQTLR